jgi:hypothetical protein
MAYIHKYREGPVLSALQAFTNLMNEEYIMVRGKPVHPSWAKSWPLHLFLATPMHAAIITEEWATAHQDSHRDESEI